MLQKLEDELFQRYRKEVQNKNAEDDKRMAEQRIQDYARYVDPTFNYYRTARLLKTQLLSDRENNSPAKYLQLLMQYLSKYDLAKRYYRHWQDADANPGENYASELDKITDLVKAEIEWCESEIEKSRLAITPVLSEKPAKATADSFGFVGNKDSLKVLLSTLNVRIDLVNNDKGTTVDDLLTVFTAKDLQLLTSPIHLSCETAQFAYIARKLANTGMFTASFPKTIEKSKLFYSHTGTLIKANNLYQGKMQTSIPKRAEDIDNAFEAFSRKK